MRFRTAWLLPLALLLTVPSAADAHLNPPGCTSTALKTQFGFVHSEASTGIVHRNGDVVEVVPRVSNDNGANPCDLEDVTLTISFPKGDGTPGPAQTIATGVDLPSGGSPIEFPVVEHTLNFDAGVFKGPVTIAYSGVQHVSDPDPASGSIGSAGRNIVITRPHATVTVTPTPASGDSPLGVTYAYSVLNDTQVDPVDTFVHVSDPALTDDRCSPVTFTGGDTNMDTLLSRGETWTYTCSTTFFGGAFTNHVALSGNSTRDGRPWPESAAQSTVNVNGPDMTLAKSHAGSFTQGDSGRAYTLTATNSGNRQATGAVGVADTLPAGLTATAISGSGWTCTLGTLTCTRSDALAAGASYPPITVTVNVADNAPASVVNTATVTRAGQNTANDTASDPTAIAAKPAPRGTSDPGTTDPTTGPTFEPDTFAPTFTARLTNRVFAVDRAGAPEPVVTARAKKGTSFVYTLSEKARVLFVIERADPGRMVGRTCRRPSRANRKRKRCVRFVRVGSFAQDGAAGPNTRPWSGKIRARALKPASYRASITARDAAGNTSTIKRLSFKIVRR